MQHWIKPLRHATLCGALLASLIMSLLPNGLLPKIAGPCGRELCNCDVTLYAVHAQTPCHDCRHQKCERHSPLRLVSGPAFVSEEPGIAFQLVFSATMLPQIMPVTMTGADEASARCQHRTFTLSSIALDIPTPPPRG